MQGSAKKATMLHLSPVPALPSHPPFPQAPRICRISPLTLGNHAHATADIMEEKKTIIVLLWLERKVPRRR
jgi:hypothetical protein